MAANLDSFDEGQPDTSTGLKRRTWLFMIVSLVVIGVGILYLYQSAKGAMTEAPDPTRTVEQIYVQRCGSCHAAPPAKDYANWARDWDRMAEITMFMADEEERVHHYLEALRTKPQGDIP
ncbi:MAG: hypothetical protein HYY30_11195 [Chloroflexi bacterium]|nr:hypothetical protein [Chloroflexota bacterium]